MSTKVKEALFELIKSMTKSEKRYFKLLAGRHTIGEENNYVILFDFLDKQTVYDEELIFNVFQKEAFINRFSITKKRLYDHILAALDAFHSTNSIDAQLHKQLHAADILYNKALYDQAKRIIRSAEKVAIKHERFIFLQEISRLNKKMIENEGYTDESLPVIEKLAFTDQEMEQHIRQYNLYWQIKSQLFSTLNTKGIARSEEDRAAYLLIFQQLTEPSERASFEEIYLYNHIQSAYYYAIQDFENSVIHLEKNLSHFENNSEVLKNQLNTYLSILTNSIYIQESLGNSGVADALLIKLKTLANEHGPELNDDMKIKLFASSRSVELIIYIKRGDFQEALSLIPEIERGIDLYDGKITSLRRSFLSFKIATVYLGVYNYSAALKWVNKIFNDPDLDPSEDIIAFTYLIDLLIHMEMKHSQLLPYALKNSQRFLKSRNKMHDFEKVFLQFIGKQIKCKDRFDEEENWQELLTCLNTFSTDKIEKIAMDYFDFRAWAEYKVTKKDFVKIIKDGNSPSQKKAS